MEIGQDSSFNLLHSRALTAQRATKQGPIPTKESKGNPWNDFVVIIARGTVSGCACTTMTSIMAAMLQLIGQQRYTALVYRSFFDTGHPCYGQFPCLKTKYPLTSIKVILFFLSGPLTKLVGCCKQGQVVWKWVDTNPRLKIKPIIIFSCIQVCFTAFVLYILRLFKLRIYGENLITKLQKSKFLLILG